MPSQTVHQNQFLHGLEPMSTEADLSGLEQISGKIRLRCGWLLQSKRRKGVSTLHRKWKRNSSTDTSLSPLVCQFGRAVRRWHLHKRYVAFSWLCATINLCGLFSRKEATNVNKLHPTETERYYPCTFFYSREI